MEPWRTAIVNADATRIEIRGHDVIAMMRTATFTDTIFLLHHERLPSAGERRLFDAILIGGADHGAGAPSCAAARLAASGNRQSASAAVAAGVLTIGEEHGGAGARCMELLAECLALARTESRSLEAAADRLVRRKRTAGERVPGYGHRVHAAIDPRVEVLFGLARDAGLDGDGIRCARAIEAALATVVRPIPLNIDGALAAVLYDLGFPPLVGTLLFIISRVAGLAAEVAEEYAREKPMRIRIPVVYDGPNAPAGSDPNGHD